MEMRPLRNNIIVRRVPDEDEHWLIPDVLRQKSLRGEIVACGPKARAVKCGDVIAFSETASKHPFAHDGGPYWDGELMVLSEMDVLCVLDG
jgi:co-chaperonin GroES (HSP10)